MCTSHVASNTQKLVSMGKQRKSKAMWLSMQMAWNRQRCRRGYRRDSRLQSRTVGGDDEFLAKMSGGDVDVEPYIYSPKTIGHENYTSNSQRPKWVKIVVGGHGK